MEKWHEASKKNESCSSTTTLVLVIDDSSFIRAYMKNILEKIGFQVICAANGLEGVAFFEKFCPPIVLIDANMPIMDGFTTCKTIRQMKNGKNALLYMITTESSKHVIEKAFQVGFDEYYKKPFTIDCVFETKMKKLIKDKQIIQKLTYRKKELDDARLLQNMLLPKEFNNKFVSIKNIFSAYDYVSGDMLDYWWEEKDETVYGYILDSMGHSLSSAMQVSAIRMLFCQATKSGLQLNSILSYINYEIFKSSTPKRLISIVTTAIIFSINCKGKILSYSAAGISPFFIMTKDGQIEKIKTRGSPFI